MSIDALQKAAEPFITIKSEESKSDLLGTLNLSITAKDGTSYNLGTLFINETVRSTENMSEITKNQNEESNLVLKKLLEAHLAGDDVCAAKIKISRIHSVGSGKRKSATEAKFL